MNNSNFALLVVIGTFVGNVLYHSAKREYAKGVIIGGIAGLIALAVFFCLGRFQ